MFSSVGQPCNEQAKTRPGFWTIVAWTWPARARVLLAFVVVSSAVALRVASDSLGVAHLRACRVVPVLVIDPNTSPPSVLEALPHVGPSLVKQLIEQREIRPFRSTQDLRRRVRGLGPATLARLAPHLRIASSGHSSTDSELPKSFSVSARAELAQWPRPSVPSR
jgi:competence protein ComEA